VACFYSATLAWNPTAVDSLALSVSDTPQQAVFWMLWLLQNSGPGRGSIKEGTDQITIIGHRQVHQLLRLQPANHNQQL
jgi:hypothetical protein